MRLSGAEGARELLEVLTGRSEGQVITRPALPGGRTSRLRAAAPGRATVLQRHVVRWRPDPRVAEPAPWPLVPEHTLVVLGEGVPDGLLAPLPDTTVLRPGAAIPGGYRHVRVLAGLPPADEWPASSPEAVLRLHDACFLAAKSAAGLLSFHVVLCGGADEQGRVHPYAGLFTGLVKAMEMEPALARAHCRVLLTSAGPVRATAELAEEAAARHVLPGVVRAGGLRLTQRAEAVPLAPARPVLAENAVVVGAGAGRGIGMTTLLGLAAHARPVLHVLGTTDLAAHDHTALTEDHAAHQARRRQVLLTATGGLAAARHHLERLVRAREVHANLARLTEICGEGRVHYHVCDTRDADAVQRVRAAIAGPVDLLLNFSGLNRTAELPVKSLADFQLVRDVKVHTYRALKLAFAAQPPRRWVNAGSLAGLLGIHGETDYSSANDFLFTAAARATGTEETTFGWGLWDGTPRAADPLVAQALTRHLSLMPAEEGFAHFLTELAQDRTEPALAYLGEVERRVTAAQLPRRTAVWAPRERPFYLDEITERTETGLVAHRVFDLDRDGYLNEHLIGGHPTLPGLLAVEIAAQAATALVPGRVPVAVREVSFSHFLRVYAGQPARKKIVAELTAGTEGESVVLVRILTDVVAPGGTVLVRDREHFRMSVVLRDRAPDCPVPDRLPVVTAPVPRRSPYQLPNPVAALSGIFASCSEVDAGAHANRARVVLDGPVLGRWFGGALLPAVLCDTLAQVCAVSPAEWSPVVVPRSIGRIDFYGGGNDLAHAGGELTVLGTRDGAWGGVFDADGRLLVRVLDVAGEVIGYVHQHTGEFRTVDEHPRPATAPPVRWPAEEPALRPQLLAYHESDFARPVQRWVQEPVPAPRPEGVGGLRGRHVLLLGLDTPLTTAVAGLLSTRGAHVTVARSAAEITAADWDGIVDLTLTGAPDYRLGEEAWRAALLTTTAALHTVYDRWLATPEADRHFYLTISHGDGLFGSSGEAVPQPLSGAWAGLAKNLMVELPGTRAKTVDLDRVDAALIADAVDAETTEWDCLEVGYRQGSRYVPHARIAPPAADAPPVGPGDCVLISGGGRGVGFELAKALAATGAEVVVTGRRELRGPGVELDEEAFAAWRAQTLIAAARTPGGLAGGREEVAAQEFVRQTRDNLAGGPPIRYLPCDVTDRAQVDAVLAALPHSPTVLVHNAATYRGVRFARLTPQEVIDTVAVRVTGFTTLVSALTARASRDRPLRLISCAGSISELGGMIGHTAYAAGSGALSRLGRWTAGHTGVPVHVVRWPTWERTGNIVSYHGAARYGSTVRPEEATAHWLAELAEGTGTVSYFGRLGVMARPHLIRAWPWPEGSPDWPRIRTTRLLLGEVLQFAEHERFVTRHRWSPAREPHLAGGALSVPVLLEHLLAAGDWVRPEGHPRQHLTEVSTLDIALAGLRLDGDLVLDFTATGQWHEDTWQVRAVVTGTEGEVATAVLHYRDQPPDLPARPPGPTRAVPVHTDADLWCGAPAPVACLPHPALHALLALPETAKRLTVRSLTAAPDCRSADAVGGTAEDCFAVAGGRAVLRLTGVTVT
ncbi:SDR family NAD(P)-dependent oxidoreductase [Lentzea sp. CC55]|uniref:SDR family NAD(P)-dependent oxidoreductase n=1 Tax=Lentzea sp. CC55 TaxID=2884909 RepID=UPI001F2F86DE|nr:SDR family NAD(P)-dependent oxidoreductase [Lentzea sp. CC55]MCG8925633.1 SDR family NAD(P)-dependent oxidoreductase [Lentzea sp. CC55]